MKEINKIMKQYEPLLYQWALNENRGNTIENYLLELDIHKILIYGAGVVGELLYQVLKKSKIQITGFIDQNKGKLSKELHGFPIMTLEQMRDPWDCDIVVVTVGHLYYDISGEIEKYNKEIKTISIETIVYGMMRGDE